MHTPTTKVRVRTNLDQSDVEVAFANAVAIVRANSYETHMLWREWHQERKHSWEQDGFGGQLVTVGWINGNKKRPVCVSVSANTIDGQRVLFIHDTSRWVDHTMIDDWLRLSFPNIDSHDDTDAQNFHNIIHLIADINKKAKVA